MQDNKNINYYVDQYNLNEIFTENMIPYMEIHYFKKNEYICQSGEKVNYLYFFVKGKSKVYITPPNGRSFSLRFYSPVQIIGEIEILNNSDMDCNVQAVTDCICIAIPRKVIEDKCLNDYKFLHYISKHLASKLSSTSILSSVNMLYSLENRLASYILETYTNEDSNNAENLTQISELLGSSYRHLLRVLNKFESEGVIKRNNKKLIILDKNRLENLAGDLYQ